LGSFLAASPLAYFASTIGWRMTFLLAGGVVILLAFSIFWALGGERQKEENLILKTSSKPVLGIFQSIRLVLGSLVFWQVGGVAFFRYGTFIGLQGLWLGPYLMDVKGYSPVQAGYTLTFLAFGAIAGNPAAGWMSDRVFNSRKGVTLWGLSLYSLSLLSLTVTVRAASPFLDGLVFFFIGFFCSFGILLYSHAKELFPVAISGTVLTGVNFFTMAGGAFFMPVLGKVIESFPRTNHTYPPQAYRLSFLICLIGMMASLVFYAFSRKEKRE
jgi:sugar phosphate permease